MITLAKTAGFCYGVKRAVNLALETARERGRACTIGPIIHNRQVVQRLEADGCISCENLEELHAGDTAIIRSHGVGRAVYEQLRARGVEIVDATCPHVEKIHRLAEEASREGRQVLIIGAKNHPEVAGISGWCGDYAIFSSAEEVENWLAEDSERRRSPLCAVSQTTFHRKIWESCTEILKKECTNLKIFDTICNATDSRRKEATQLAALSDVMLVVGDRESSNTMRLVEFCRESCGRAFLVENAEQLKPVLPAVRPGDAIGMTAGASTPAWIIKEVYDKMTEEIKDMVEETKVETPVEESAPQAEEEMSFAEMLEQSIKTLNTGEKVTGVVTGITPTEIYVDLGTKHAGYIPVSELTDDPTAKVEDLVKIGDEIETYVMRVNDQEGVVTLSKKRLDTVKSWDDIEQAREEHTTVEGVVTEENKGGVVVSIKGVRVFVPASQTGLPRETPMSQLLKQHVRLRITEVNRARRRVVGSIRAVEAEERAAKAAEVWANIEENKRYTGTVKSLTSYGAFVDIGGVDGMVHISELSWSRIKHPSEVVSVGDTVEVYVISFDKEKKKISLGMKDRSQNPWEVFTGKYQPGDVANVRVVKLMTFGAFAEVVPGVDGLIHISQIADHRIDKPGDVLSEGQMVDVKIIDIDYDNKKVSLSIRALLEGGDEPAESEDVNEE